MLLKSNQVSINGHIQNQIEAIQMILSDESLLYKATILDTMQNIKNILSQFCDFSGFQGNSNRIHEPLHPVFSFGQDILLDSYFEDMYSEDSREMLFFAVGMDFISLSHLIASVRLYHDVIRKMNSNPSLGICFQYYNAQQKVQQLSKMSFISMRSPFTSSPYPKLMIMFLGMDYRNAC